MWRALKDDIENDIVVVNDERLSDIRKAILYGNPEDANEHIVYAHILRLEEAL